MKKTEKASRGRPKTLDRERVLNTAVMSYWADGPTAVSLNEICKRAGVSKPGLYREFGNEDGLKQAALVAYSSIALAELNNMLDSDKSFAQALEALSAYMVLDRKKTNLPLGCLHVSMSNCIEQLGALTVEKVNEIQRQTLALYESWIKRAKANDEFKADMSTRLAALYIDEQIRNAMLQQERGVAHKDIKAILKLAFSVLV